MDGTSIVIVNILDIHYIWPIYRSSQSTPRSPSSQRLRFITGISIGVLSCYEKNLVVALESCQAGSPLCHSHRTPKRRPQASPTNISLAHFLISVELHTSISTASPVPMRSRLRDECCENLALRMLYIYHDVRISLMTEMREIPSQS